MDKLNVTQKLIQDHLLDGLMEPGKEIALKVDHMIRNWGKADLDNG